MVAEAGRGSVAISDAAEHKFQVAESPQKSAHRMESFSLTYRLSELKASADAEVHVLGRVAKKGDVTILFGDTNTGKTLLTMSLLVAAIKSGAIDPSTVHYLNMDDSFNGLLQKLEIANQHGIHMHADGFQGFEAGMLSGLIEEFTKSGDTDIIFVVDTLTKIVDPMDKSAVRMLFAKLRRFCTKGGTVILLAHTNKKADASGRPIPGGVGDLKNDADCAHTLRIVNADSNDDKAVVEFTRIKARGNIAKAAAYSYSRTEGISYKDLFLSVRAVDESQLDALHVADGRNADRNAIQAISDCITEGICSKLSVRDAASKRARVSGHEVLRILAKYAGTNPATHIWNFTVGNHNTYVYYMLQPLPPPGEATNNI